MPRGIIGVPGRPGILRFTRRARLLFQRRAIEILTKTAVIAGVFQTHFAPIQRTGPSKFFRSFRFAFFFFFFSNI